MWPGTKLTLLSESLFKSLFRLLFRYDIFISYARGDGKEYAVKLRDQLKQLDFSCFLDFDELPPGNSLNNTLKRAIRKSAILVVVGTERAIKSRYVELEVDEFASTGRAIIPIDIEGTLADTPWRVIKERDIVWIDEVQGALTKGVPSPNVADSIDKLFKYTRRNSRVRAQVLSTIVLFVVVVVAALFMIRQQVNAATIASAKAEVASADAKNQKITADKATADARIAEGNAETARVKAATAEKAAVDAAEDARKQEEIALANAERAKAEQARAEERTRYVLAQQIGVQADFAREPEDDLERSVLLSVESLKRAATPEGYIAWERSMNLLPHPVENSSGATKMWDPEPFELPENLKSYAAEWPAISPDGRYSAIAGPSTGALLRLFDLRNSTLVLEKQLEEVSYVMSVAFTPNGKWLAIGLHPSGGVSQVVFWDVASFDKAINETPKPVASISIEGSLYRMAFSPQGNYLAVEDSTTGLVNIWSIYSDKEPITATKQDQLLQIKGGGAGVRSTLVFSPDENYLATTPNQNTVAMWEVDTGRKISSIGHQKDIEAIVFSPDGRFLATKGESIAFWKTEFGSEAQRIAVSDESSEVELNALAVSPSGEWLAIGSSDGAKVLTLTGSPIVTLAQAGKVSKLTFDNTGRWLVTASEDKVTAFDTKKWRGHVIWAGDKLAAPDIGFSPDGRRLVVVTGSLVRLFEYGSWRELNTMNHSDPVSKVFFSPEGQWMAVRTLQEHYGGHSRYQRLRTYVWEANTSFQVACRTDKLSRSRSAMPEPPDAKGLVCSESKTNQQQALLSEAQNWKQVLRSDDLDTTSRDGLWSAEVKPPEITLNFRDGKASRRVAGLTPDGKVKDLAFSPDNRWLVIGSANAVMIWPLKPADMIDAACKRLRRRDLTLDEWRRYFSGEKLQPTCPPQATMR